MGARVEVDLSVLQDAYERAEAEREAAAEAERVAFERWQEAMGAYEVARDESSAAWSAYASAVGP